MSLVTRPTMVDDTGTFDNGTAVNKAFVDDLLDEVDDQCHSSTNPTIKPKATTDEVVTARGNLASLNARLAAVVDADGVPVPSAAAVTETQGALLPQTNCVLNDTLIIWAAGDSVAPTGWTLAGTGAACARAGTGLGDTKRKVGDFCAKLTYGSATLTLEQDVLPTAAFSRLDHLKSTGVGYGAWVWANIASQSRIYVTDGVTTTYSSYHTGNSTWQWLTVEHTLSASATKLTVGVAVGSSGANPAYFSGPTLVLGSIAPGNWRPTPTLVGTLHWPGPGAQTTGTAKGWFTVNRMGIVKHVECNLRTAATGATTFKVDVNKGGTSMFGGTKVEFVASDKNAGKAPDGTYADRCFAGNTLASGTTITDEITYDIDAIGSTIAGSDLSVKVRMMVFVDPFESVKAA